MYCTLADLAGRYGEKKILAWAKQNKSTIELAINDASSEIDGYLVSGGYKLPLITVPDMINAYSVSLAVYNLLTVEGLAEKDLAETILSRAKNAREYLKEVAAGSYEIPGLSKNSTVNPFTSSGEKTGIYYKTDEKISLKGRLF